MKRQTAINMYSDHISHGGEWNNTPFFVKWRLRLSRLMWLSPKSCFLSLKSTYMIWRLPRMIKAMSPKQRGDFKKILDDLSEAAGVK
ncbi:hypothetical protein LCGC14_2873930 [marine sediment metagenome]|uniref:Uncharacterized protein n=1 Tax=marine sediment metagenome TaxID=412755 RepID=A0A0F9AAB6_9ZZZZ